ncbi:MAG TPA: amino acid permease [Spirochaetota bacterium]|nr:amino acid permease [Spirochaetota bacterium]HPI88258.1 amino acid permease [Spirochaetota bacterium]HPR47198.1 amino acid permease [Spirochaetota bacterium]
MDLKRQLGPVSGVLIIIADMIGSGIFMTTGNVLGMTGNALLVLALWLLGGAAAIAGTLCYAELATMWPDEGGEYVYLKKSFGLLPAFLTGWVSLIVGFSAPVATASILAVEYTGRFLQAFPPLGSVAGLLSGSGLFQKAAASGIIVFFSLLHILGVRKGGYFQNALTVVKVALVVSMVILGFWAVDWGNAHRLYAQYNPGGAEPGLPVTALALLIIMFAYSGWNGATYIAGEIREPEKNLPRILLAGTVITALLYVLLNIVFIMSAEGPDLMGRDEIAAIAAGSLFGPKLAGFLTIVITIILLSSISVQMMVGPRVCYAMAKDGMIFRSLANVHERFGTPHRAILLQMFLAVLYVMSGNAMTLVIYMGFALNIFPLLAVVGLVYMRVKCPGLHRPYRVPLYPLVPLVYIVLSSVMMAAALVNWTATSFFALGAVALGVPVYFIWKRFAPAG